MKESYKETTICVLVSDHNTEISRKTETRRVYVDKVGARFVHSRGKVYPLNEANEWRQNIHHTTLKQRWL